MKKSQIEFENRFPSAKSLGIASVLLYDQYFDQDRPELKSVQTWIHSFPHRLALACGEDLKDLRKFPDRIETILKIVSTMAVKNVQIVGLGGGSLGDFAGFVASILKRGLPLVHIPTTWLSAMDSSHGGKTALNVSGFKNQVGTFYPADKIVLVKEILLLQPESRSQEAFGEAIKMALLQGGDLWVQFSKIKQFSNQIAWKFLPQLIAGKYRIVAKDPFEEKGIRHLLNLGHTLGHVWEITDKLPHGLAVAYGIRAAIELSRKEKILTEKNYLSLFNTAVIKLLPTLNDLQKAAQSVGNVSEYLVKDKKISKKNTLRYIFIQKPGVCPIHDISIARLADFHSELKKSLIT